MSDNDVIKESFSPWAVQIVLVEKKNRSWHFCVDYRKLNALTHRDAYLLPRIEESLTSFKLAMWYYTLDHSSEFWQVEVHPKTMRKLRSPLPWGSMSSKGCP